MTLGLDTLLRLLASTEVGATLTDVRPAVVLNRQTLLPVFGNAGALHAFERTDLASLAAEPLPLAAPLAARLARFAANPAPRRSDLVRYEDEDGEHMERLDLVSLNDAAGEDLILVTLASRSVAIAADDAYGIAHLADENRFVVLFDEEGDAVASHGDESLLDDIHDEVEALAGEDDGEAIRRRTVRSKDGDREIALVALAGGPEQILLLVRLPRPDRKARLKVPPRRRAPSETASDKGTASGGAPTAEATDSASVEAAPAPEAVAAEVVVEATPAPVAEAKPAPVAEAPAPQPAVESADVPETIATDAPIVEPVIDDVAFVEAEAAPEATPPAVSVEDAAAPETVEVAPPAVAEAHEPFPTEAAPRKFVWQMDAERRFAFVSPELAAAVGDEAAPRVGESWADVASRLTIDIDGRVAHAIAGADTWSGLTILWPIAGAARRVPVDLAALPVIGRKRAFEGFRGFGTLRPAETLDDVTATGLRLVPQPEPTLTPAPAPAIVPAAVAPAPRAEATIVPLRPAAEPGEPPSRLSAPERTAFRQIAQALGARIEGDDFVPVAGPPAPPAETRVAPPCAEARTPAPAAEAALIDRLTLPCLVSGDDEILHANPAFLSLLGYADLADLEAHGGVEALFADEYVLRDAMRAQVPKPVPALTRSGEVIPVHARLATVPWGGGNAVLLTLEAARAPRAEAEPRVDTSHRDDDRRLAAEAGQMRARVAELETILDTATDGVLILDGNGIIVTANRAAEALFGLDRAAFGGKPLADLLAPESRRAALDYLDGLSSNGVASVLNDGREVIGEVHPDGLIPLFMTVGRLGSGDSRRFCAVLRDITQWKKSEEDLTTARRRAEEASLHKSDFLAKISHEIRTPLNAIIGFSEVMLDERFGPMGNDRYRDYMRDIHASGSHIMSLVNDLLDLSKVEAGKMDLKFEAVPLADLIGECVALMQPQANRERIIIRTSLPATVPPIVADTRSVRQIVLNLLSNAVKFTPAGGQVIVSIVLEESGEVVIRVRDTGHGMTEKEIETALEPFRQLHTTQSSTAGTGLGLPLTKALVEANRATFGIDSTPGQGTLVSITFPVNRVLAG
jgi:PAS domain S-box-containing protein